MNILVAVTGSVATVKIIELVEKLLSRFDNNKDQIRVITTENSKSFVAKEAILNCGVQVLDDSDEWTAWKTKKSVLHIELRDWADILLIAPLDANTMAKMANGLCDNLLTCVVRAWDLSKKLIYCPAMNTQMLAHPVTQEHFEKLDKLGYSRIDCVEKLLACGDFGLGAMASVDTIVERVVDVTQTGHAPR